MLAGMSESYLPISDYGMIGDGRAVALISRLGSIDWCCLPRIDSPSVFGALLDLKQGGCFSLRPNKATRATHKYVDDTNVLETTFETSTGSVVMTDAFFATSAARSRRRLRAEHEIIRTIEATSGSVTMELYFAPRPNYGRNPVKITKRGVLGISCAEAHNPLHLRSDLDLCECSIQQTASGPEARLQFKVCAGEKVRFSLVSGSDAPVVFPPLGQALDERLQETIDYWKGWAERCEYDGPYKNLVRRSALALKLMVFAPSGAIIAAPTTSLPEKIGGQRNWDYRFCWLRDASLTVQSFISLGYFDEADAFVNWILHSTRQTRPHLQVLYEIYGESKIEKEGEHESWEGYKQSSPVRIGNAARNQFQLDIYGEALNALYLVRTHHRDLKRDIRKFIYELANVVANEWEKPDNGIWEVRSERKQHTHSKVMAWVALDRMLRLNHDLEWNEPIKHLIKEKMRLQKAIEQEAYSQDMNSYVGIFNTHHLDASLLTMPLYGYCDANSDRMINTYEAIKKYLMKNKLTYRYTTIDDGLPHGEAAFLACSFWAASYLAKAGRTKEAEEVFNSLVEHSNPLGLWSEEMDTHTFEYLGNYPQAFSHVGLINAAVEIERSRKRSEHELH